MFCTVRLKVLLTKHDLSEGRSLQPDYFYFLFFIFIFLFVLLFSGEFFGVFSIIYM